MMIMIKKRFIDFFKYFNFVVISRALLDFNFPSHADFILLGVFLCELNDITLFKF